MASPLSDRGDMALNTNASLDASQKDNYEVTCYTTKTYVDNDSDGLPSSPFVANISDPAGVENVSPSKMSRSRTTSPTESDPTSPLKPLKSRASPISKDQSPNKTMNTMRSPRKLSSPEKRFPVRPSMSPEKQTDAVERKLSIEVALAENNGLTKAINILEDADSENEERLAGDESTFLGPSPSCDEATNMDESTFSTFSAIPDMTTFAKVGHSPTKYTDAGPTPRRNQVYTPAIARRPTNNRSPSPTPRGHRFEQDRDDGNTTNLLDFTEQFNNFSTYSRQSPSKHSRQSLLKNTTMPDMPWASTPTINRNNMSNLLDFDIPPAPTPRSMPSITPRELESLKSGFLSEISSLKASLSGKEAEVSSLKTAVGDAEKRVGESLEQVREERGLKEQLAAEKEEWERRGREMEAVLRNVKDEIVHGERDRDDLEGRLEESERRREAAEVMAQEAESKLAAVKTGKPPSTAEQNDTKPGECGCGGRAVEIAVEKVSRELHTLYKDKHETKVAALKKSYERRWEKKIKDLEGQIGDLTKENEELRQGRDATMTKVEPKSSHEVTEDLKKQAAKDAKSKELEAELEGLNEVVKSVKQDNSHLRRLLDEERVEKGKLVAAVDEMIPVVAAFDDMLAEMNSAPANQQPSVPSISQNQTSSVVENLRGSISRASGLRAPTSISSLSSGESRIGRGGFGAPAGHSQEKSRSGSSHGTRPGSGLGYQSGIMSSIQRMGSHKGRGD